MSTVIELTVADNEHEDIAIVWHAHQSYSGLGALGIWARRSRHGVAVRSVPGGNKTNRTIPQSYRRRADFLMAFPNSRWGWNDPAVLLML
jgi:hypothetical protein